MKKMIIVRHGQSEHNLLGIVGGWGDYSLTEIGKKQATLTGQYLKKILNNQECAIYCSDLRRTQQTAQIICDILGSNYSCVEGLRELSNGDANGLTKDEARKIRNHWSEGNALEHIHYPNGESWRMMNIRICECMEKINSYEAETVIVITHANSTIAIINWWLGIKEDDLIEKIMYKMDPSSITVLSVDSDKCKSIIKLNDTSHLI